MKPKNVTVPMDWWRKPPEDVVTVQLIAEEGYGDWTGVWLDDVKIGRVQKSTYTYSPPLHKGSRIARYHRQVACWRSEAHGRSNFETRREALRAMVRDHRETVAA